MRLRHAFSVIALAGMSLAACAHATCKMQFEQHYTCDREAFAKQLAEAKTIRVEAARTDLFGADRTQKLVQNLGKQTATSDQPADLTFQLAAVDHSGMDIGAQDTALARLNVYDPNHQLVWVETLDGSQSIPWTADVIELLKHFQGGVASGKRS